MSDFDHDAPDWCDFHAVNRDDCGCDQQRTAGAQLLDDIEPPARVTVPPLMRGYLRLGAKVCGDPAYDPDFGVGDFPALLDKREADVRYLTRLRSAAAATDKPAQ